MKQKEALERETMMKEAKEREALQERLQREAKATEESKQRLLLEARPLKRDADLSGKEHVQDGAGDSLGRAPSTVCKASSFEDNSLPARVIQVQVRLNNLTTVLYLTLYSTHSQI